LKRSKDAAGGKQREKGGERTRAQGKRAEFIRFPEEKGLHLTFEPRHKKIRNWGSLGKKRKNIAIDRDSNKKEGIRNLGRQNLLRECVEKRTGFRKGEFLR